MAEPVRNYTPRRDAREELRRKIEDAPVDHAQAILSAYELLQEAQDHGVLDTLRGAIGAGGAAIGKISEYASTPEGIRLLRNLLAAARLLGELDPGTLDAANRAVSRIRRDAERNSRLPGLFQSLRRLSGIDSRRTLDWIARFSETFGNALQPRRNRGESTRLSSNSASGMVVPVVASAAIVMIAGFWIGRRSNSR